MWQLTPLWSWTVESAITKEKRVNGGEGTQNQPYRASPELHSMQPAVKQFRLLELVPSTQSQSVRGLGPTIIPPMYIRSLVMTFDEMNDNWSKPLEEGATVCNATSNRQQIKHLHDRAGETSWRLATHLFHSQEVRFWATRATS